MIGSYQALRPLTRADFEALTLQASGREMRYLLTRN